MEISRESYSEYDVQTERIYLDGLKVSVKDNYLRAVNGKDCFDNIYSDRFGIIALRSDEVEDLILDLLGEVLPEENGIYEITGTAEIPFEVDVSDNGEYIKEFDDEYWSPDYYLDDVEVDGPSVDVSYEKID